MTPLDLRSVRVGVLGLGISGRAVTRVLSGKTAGLVLIDSKTDALQAALEDPELIAQKGVETRLVDEVSLDGIGLLVTSPGWPPSTPLLRKAAQASIPIWSEVELAWHLRVRPEAPWLAITGTNGKTTTVQMLEAMLNAGGLRALAVGNVGTALVEAVTDPQWDIFAVELSSFQLHYTESMSALAATVLNVAHDHLDWHGSMEAYAADKGKVFTGVRKAAIYNVQAPITRDLVNEAEVSEGARAVGFSLGIPRLGELGMVGELLVDRAFHAERRTEGVELASLRDLQHLAGPAGLAPHVMEDALAAAALARAAEIGAKDIRRALRGFALGHHRVEKIIEIDGVSYVDDSKATNPHAAAAALAGMNPGSVVWIAGGLRKGAEYDDLVRQYADKLRAVVVIGEDAEHLSRALDQHAPKIPRIRIDPQHTGGVMQDAVLQARALAHSGDSVLLAPASASMDQFIDYADRGEQFAQAARALVG